MKHIALAALFAAAFANIGILAGCSQRNPANNNPQPVENPAVAPSNVSTESTIATSASPTKAIRTAAETGRSRGVLAPRPVAVTLTGKNYHLLDALAPKAEPCSDEAFTQMKALRITEAHDHEGKPFPELAGKSVHYLPTKTAAPLLSGDDPEETDVLVTGTLFKDSNALLVETHEANDDGWVELMIGEKSAVQVLESAPEPKEPKPEAIAVKLVGLNYGLLNALAEDEIENADPACAKRNAVRITKATDPKGNSLPKLIGKTVHYLPTKRAEALLTNENQAGKEVEVTGRLFQNEAALLVEEHNAEDLDDWDAAIGTGPSGAQQL